MVCLIAGMVIGAAAMKFAATQYFPQQGPQQGFNTTEMLAAGLSGGLGALIGSGVWWLIGGRRPQE